MKLKLRYLIGTWYDKFFVLSNLDKKSFVDMMEKNLKDYDSMKSSLNDKPQKNELNTIKSGSEV